MARIDWRVYFASREWALLKEQVRQRSYDRCERCHFGRYEQTHHLNYKRPGHEEVDDLMAVCAACHEYLSGKRELDPRAAITVRVSDLLDASGWMDGVDQVHCPVCGYEYVHFFGPEHVESHDNYEARPGFVRGDVISVPMWCEAGHEFALEIGFHKGGTFMRWAESWGIGPADRAIREGSWASLRRGEPANA